MRNLTQTTLRVSKFFNPTASFFYSTKVFSRFNLNLGNLFMTNRFFFGNEAIKTTNNKIHQNIQKSQFAGDGFYMQQLLTGCLSIYSYYIQSGNQAFLIDPLNETQKYDEILKKRGKTLKGVFLTHYHADYIAGHFEIKKKYNCQIYLGPTALETFGIKALKDGEQLKVGNIKLKVIHTPGHTQESSCMLLIDSKNKQQALFTGDTIFLNEVGRPDLAVKTNLSSSDLAGMLFESLQKVKKLDNSIRIYPGHGSGSACGKSIGKGDFCHLGTQKQNNYGLKQTNKQKFVKDLLHQMPSPPQYFGYNAGVNKFEPFDYDQAYINSSTKIQGNELKQFVQKQKATIIDVRSNNQLKQGIIKGAIAIDFDGGFANWAGRLLSPHQNLIIYGGQDLAKQSIKRLLRIGYKNIKGYCSDNIKTLGKNIQVYKPDFVPTVNVQGRTILDVRKPAQYEKGISQGDVINYQITQLFQKNAKDLDKSKKYVVHCQSGYRAKIAYTFLKNLGYDVKVYGDGGAANFQKIGVKCVKPGH